MRILAVTNIWPAPDAPHWGRFVEQQIKALRQAGLELDVLYVNRRVEGMRAYANLPGLLSKAVDRFKPHLVHVMYGGIMARIVTLVVRDRPVMVTFHGSDLLGQPFERPLRRFFAAGGVLASRQAARQCDGIVVVAGHLIDKLPKEIPRSQIRVIPCGIDLDLFTPQDQDRCRQQLGWAQDSFHVIFQATGDPVKRPELALAAIDRLRDQGVNVELHFLRGVNYEQVPVWLNAGDALLVTSYHEGSPTIVKESLACNLPIVSVPVGDIPRMIQDVKGCHLSAADAMELAVKLHKVRVHSSQISGGTKMHDLSVAHSACTLKRFYEDLLVRRGVGDDERVQEVSHENSCG